MTIVLDLAPEQEAQLRVQASAQGMTPADYLKSLAGLPQAVSEIAAWEAMVDSFGEGDAEDHRETLELLKRVLDEDRPGQRRIFGTGYNLRTNNCMSSDKHLTRDCGFVAVNRAGEGQTT